MRFLIWVIVFLAAAFFIFEMVVNIETLSREVGFNVSLPWSPIGVLAMPLWVALIAAVSVTFLVTVAIEVVAWYEYTRTIRLQRIQIISLQKALQSREGTETPTSTS